jgi:hypothetical protein
MKFNFQVNVSIPQSNIYHTKLQFFFQKHIIFRKTDNYSSVKFSNHIRLVFFIFDVKSE